MNKMPKIVTRIITVILMVAYLTTAIPMDTYALRPQASRLSINRGDEATLIPPDLSRAKPAPEGTKSSSAGKLEAIREFLPMPEYTEDVIAALKSTNGNLEQAAKIFNISEAAIGNRIKLLRVIAIAREEDEIVDRLNEVFSDKDGKGKQSKLSLPTYTEPTISALVKRGGDIVKAGEILGITYAGLRYRIATIFAYAKVLGREDIYKRLMKALNLADEQAVREYFNLPKYTEKVIAAVEKARGNIGRAAKAMKLNKKTLMNKMMWIIRITAIVREEEDILNRLDEALSGEDATLRRSSLTMPRFTMPTIRAFEEAGGNRRDTCAILGITDGTL